MNKPIKMDMKAGTYAICPCGKTKNAPFCDGAHVGTDFKPLIVKIEEDKRVAWCSCGKSKKAPFCDGAHTK